MERSKVRLFVDRLHVESKEERIVRIISGKTVKNMRRKAMNGQDAGSADYRELRLIKESEKSTVHLVQKKDEDQIYIRKILRGGGKCGLSNPEGMPSSFSAQNL